MNALPLLSSLIQHISNPQYGLEQDFQPIAAANLGSETGKGRELPPPPQRILLWPHGEFAS